MTAVIHPSTYDETRAQQDTPTPSGVRLESAATREPMLMASLQAHLSEIRAAIDSASQILDGFVDSGSTDVVRRHAAQRIPRWHFPMLNDHERNDSFAAALDHAIQPGDHVLDIGSGTGLLAMMAVQAGAAHVTTCEADPLLAEVARRVIADNGMSGEITVVNAMSTQLSVGAQLSERADLIVTEIVDCGLIGEGILPTLRHARQELLKPGGRLIPSHGRVRGALLASPIARNLNRVTQAAGFDVRTLNTFATPGHFPLRLNTWPHTVLGADIELVAFNLLRGDLHDGHRVLELPVEHNGHADGIVAWFEMDLGHGTVLRNSPDNAASHWMQAFLPFATTVDVQAGSTLPVDIAWHGITLTATCITTSTHSNQGNLS